MDKRCYQPRHPMESTPFLIKTPTPDEPWQSTTRSTFVPPRNDMLKREGRKKNLLKHFFWQEMVEEMTRKMMEPKPIEEYNTEYIESFGDSEFVPSLEKISEESELHKKFPLYTGAPLTFWHDNVHKLAGVSRSVDPLQPFKRNSAFTRPLGEVLDEPIKPL
ncbi:hypothetical protein L9F63_000755 [Diploptera punctata]|uniref:Uncharacterized protein n=1 Tax=Diploptera punctata TaxID=6984 RepID=A0AAD8AL02_DIPPU|nr:hypothetical protein L9F63_000755 [Diploptera punctata]